MKPKSKSKKDQAIQRLERKLMLMELRLHEKALDLDKKRKVNYIR